MDPAFQIDLLKKEHENAINSFDFDRAESISKQIGRLQAELDKTKSKEPMDLTVRRESLQSKTHNMSAKQVEEMAKIQRKFQARNREIQERQTKELNDLALAETEAIHREMSRPVHEAEVKFQQSKTFGNAHEYEMAKLIYQDACQIKETVVQKRVERVKAVFENQKTQLKRKHDKENALLQEKLMAAKAEQEQKLEKELDRIQRTQHANEIKASFKPKQRPTVSNVMTPRKRSASVTRNSVSASRRSSSVSRNSSRLK